MREQVKQVFRSFPCEQKQETVIGSVSVKCVVRVTVEVYLFLKESCFRVTNLPNLTPTPTTAFFKEKIGPDSSFYRHTPCRSYSIAQKYSKLDSRLLDARIESRLLSWDKKRIFLILQRPPKIRGICMRKTTFATQ